MYGATSIPVPLNVWQTWHNRYKCCLKRQIGVHECIKNIFRDFLSTSFWVWRMTQGLGVSAPQLLNNMNIQEPNCLKMGYNEALSTYSVMPAFIPGLVSSRTHLWRMTLASIEVSDFIAPLRAINVSSKRPSDCLSSRGLNPLNWNIQQ